MAASDHLGPQFLSHEELGSLRASDYAGHVRDGVPAMESWVEKFGSNYAEGRQPVQTSG